MAIENKENQTNDVASVLVISVLFSTVAIVASTYYFINKQTAEIQTKVQQSIEKMEAVKVGGEDNFKLLQKLYSNTTFKEQQGKQIEQALQQFGGDSAQGSGATSSAKSPSAADAGEEFKTGTLTAEQIDSLTKGAYVKGSKDAKIAWIEYSDLECPFCKKHHVNGTTETVMEKNQGNIQYIFKNYPLNFHPLAQKGAESLECVGELGGEAKYYEFLDKAFKADSPTVAALTSIADELGIKKDKFTQCLDSGKHADAVQAQMKQGLEVFNITGTPGNILINLETLKYVIIPGAYPAESFEAELAKLMK